MKRICWLALAMTIAVGSTAAAQQPSPLDKDQLSEATAFLGVYSAVHTGNGPLSGLVGVGGLKSVRSKAQGKLPLSGMTPSKLSAELCLLKYPISTTSAECQAYFNEGLGYFYSYVWMEAVRSFETATLHDPTCPMAWWGLSRALERHSKPEDGNKALQHADALKHKANHREQQLILARMQEKGLAPNVGDAEARKKAAIQTLDNLLAMYDDDEEAWYYRAQLAGGSGLFGGQVSSVPFYKALLHVNPLHPGANHELVHFYENFRRPALGWPYAENYIKSSPGIPHPFHMQAHLATRIGRWDKTSDRSSRAVELERNYHKFMAVKPAEDHQFSHHLETLSISLIHDGRFREARAAREEAEKSNYKHWDVWFRLHNSACDWEEAFKIVEHFRKTDKQKAGYLSALIYLKQGNIEAATAEVEILQEAYRRSRTDKKLELQLWETQGWLMCKTGEADSGLKLIKKAVDRTKNDYSHHAWGNGAYHMEVWGIAALHAGKNDVAEEAFLEAIAHDPGSVRAAIGMQVLCERLNRIEESQKFTELARRAWSRADSGMLDREWAYLRGEDMEKPKR